MNIYTNKIKMKKVSLILSTILMTTMVLSSCGSKDVTIGNQVWMAENMNIDKFRNGDPIPEAKTDREWELAGKRGEPAWCYYDNDQENGQKYGKLYNWYAVNDSRGLAPAGYHIPSDAEWKVLTDHLGGESEAGGKMKSIGTQYWRNPNVDANNESGFSGVPGGLRDYNGTFNYIGFHGYWWSSSQTNWSSIRSRNLDHYDGNVNRFDDSKNNGFSVRCLRD